MESPLINKILNRIAELGITPYQFGKQAGIKGTKHYAWLEGRAEPKSEDTLLLEQWLKGKNVTNNGEIKTDTLPEKYTMLNETKEKGGEYLTKRRVLKHSSAEMEVPVYFGNTRAGNIEVYSDDPEYQTPVASLPPTLFPGCNHAEKVNGQSMYPVVMNQSLVVGKKIDKAGIIAGDIYGIHTKYGQSVIKYIHPSVRDGFIKLVSHNKTIPDHEIPLDDVTFCFRVHFIINPS